MLKSITKLIRSGSTNHNQHPLLPLVLATVGPDVASSKDFYTQVPAAIEAAVDYFDRQISTIPGSLTLTETLATSGGIAALFPEVVDVTRALGRSLEVKESLPRLLQEGHSEIHALLGMRCRPGSNPTDAKPIYADHAIRSLASSPEQSRETLRNAAFERLIRNFAEHVEKLRRKERLSNIEWEWNLRHDIAKTIPAEHGKGYVYAAKELTPDNIVRGLISWLNTPETFFRLELNGAIVQVPPTNLKGSIQTFELPLLHCSDRRQWQVCFVRFFAEDGAEALAREKHMHRYIFI